MITGFFVSIGIDFSIFVNFFVCANLSMSASPIILLPFIGPLMPVLLNITKPFHIKKPIISTNNTMVTKILKNIIWIAKVLFPFLNKAWQYMLGIPNHVHNYKL